jgi:RNA polymerase sigma-70 factor (ECF subfamily)
MPPDAADFSTDDVVAAVRRGEIELYRQIVVRYQGDVLKVVNAMLLDASAREDVVQQVFVLAFRRLDQYELGRGFGKWLKGIARHQVLEELRKRRRYRGRLDAYAGELEQRLRADEPADTDAERERRDALRECIESLEESTRRALRLHYVEARPTDVVGHLLGRSGGAVRTLLCRARGQLRRCLEAKGVLS